MPSYRGVEKDALIESVKQAHAFLRKLNIGPVANRAVDFLLGLEKTGELGLADTNQELHYAVNDTKIGLTMALFSKVLRFHALADPAPEGGKSEALDIYTKLAAWGAFPPKQFHAFSTMDDEINAHLLPAFANALTDADEEPGSDAQKRLEAFLTGVRQSETRQGGHDNIAKWLEESIPLVISLSKMGGSEAEVAQILEGNPTGATIIPGALEIMLNLDQRLDDLHIESPINTYRVSLGMLPQDDDEQQAVYRPVLQEIQDLMQPFLRRDEMIPNMIMVVDPHSGEGNIVLFATLDAMQYLADHLPEDMPLYDAEGQRILPPRASPPQPGPSPAPGF